MAMPQRVRPEGLSSVYVCRWHEMAHHMSCKVPSVLPCTSHTQSSMLTCWLIYYRADRPGVEYVKCLWPCTADGGHTSKKVKLQHRGAKQPKAIVLDIEGTVAPISFVTETLFPYARARVTEHLTHTFESEETQADLDLLRQQVLPSFRHTLFSCNQRRFFAVSWNALHVQQTFECNTYHSALVLLSKGGSDNVVWCMIC